MPCRAYVAPCRRPCRKNPLLLHTLSREGRPGPVTYQKVLTHCQIARLVLIAHKQRSQADTTCYAFVCTVKSSSSTCKKGCQRFTDWRGASITGLDGVTSLSLLLAELGTCRRELRLPVLQLSREQRPAGL